MKIGIGIFTAPEAGGAYQYTRSVIQAAALLMKKEDGQFDFCCYSLYDMWEPICRNIGVPYKRLIETKFQKGLYHMGHVLGQLGGTNSGLYNTGFYKFHPIWKAYVEDGLDAVFITSPSWYGKPCGAKLIMPIFDVMHRYIDFPEIGEGKIGQERDRRYTSICKGADVILADSKLGVMQIVSSYGNAYDGLIRKVYDLPFIVPDYVDEYIKKNVEICAAVGVQAASDAKNNSGAKEASDGKKTRLAAEITRKLPKKYILYPAQFWKHKNHVGLIKAAGELKKKGILVNLVFTGSGKNAQDDIDAAIEDTGLVGQITNLGYVTDEELVELYKGARAMMFASFGGPTNIPPLEAMALGCPVAVSDNFAMPGQLDGAGLIFNPESVSDIADAMRRLWCDDVLCENLREKGLTRNRQWTVKEFAARLEEVLQAAFAQQTGDVSDTCQRR